MIRKFIITFTDGSNTQIDADKYEAVIKPNMDGWLFVVDCASDLAIAMYPRETIKDVYVDVEETQ